MARIKGLEKIKQKILDDAARAAKENRAEARQRVAAFKKARQAEADAYEAKAKDQTAAMVESRKQRGVAQARLEAKRLYLEERERIINDAMNDALANLDHDDKAYHAYLERVITEQQGSLDGKQCYRCSKEDERLVKKLVKRHAAKATVTVDENVTAGLIIEDEHGKRVDETIQATMERRKDEIRQRVVELLNKKENNKKD